jgi:hypothetical protein
LFISLANSSKPGLNCEKSVQEKNMLFVLYYIIAIAVLILHFTGVLARYNMEWLVLVLAVTVFPAVIYL